MVKKLQFIKALTEKGKDNKLVAVASDETKDRAGDSLGIKTWKLTNYKKNPVLLFAHDYRQLPIGVAEKIWMENKKLKFIPKFQTVSQVGQQVKTLYEEGFLKAWSVGFIPKYKDNKLVSNELLEISAVPVPANPNALVEAKAKGLKVDLVNKFIKEMKKKNVKKITKKVKKTKKKVTTVDLKLRAEIDKLTKENEKLQKQVTKLEEASKAKAITRKATTKGRNTKVLLDTNEVLVKALQTIARNTNWALSKKNKLTR